MDDSEDEDEKFDHATKANELRELIKEFLSKVSYSADVEFSSRFLNSDTAARVAYNGQRLASNGYTKFYFILHCLENIDSILSKDGQLYTLIKLSASRHQHYNIPPANAQRLYDKLFNSLKWTLRNAFKHKWTEQREELLAWGWKIISDIYMNANRLQNSSIARRLTLARRNSKTFVPNHDIQNNGSIIESILSTKEPRQSFMNQFQPTLASKQNLSPDSSILPAIIELQSENTHSRRNKLANARESIIEIKEDVSKSNSSYTIFRHNTMSRINSLKATGGYLSICFRTDLSLSFYIMLSMIRVFLRITQFFDQLSDILLALNVLPKLHLLKDEGWFDQILIYLVTLIPLLPYFTLIPLLYKGIFGRLHKLHDTFLSTLLKKRWYLCHFLYFITAIPTFIILDLYIYTFKLFSNLADTKYLYPYWGTKSVVEIFAESIPQSILLLTLYFKSQSDQDAVIDINGQLLVFGFCTSFTNIFIRMGELQYAAGSHKITVWQYVSNHLFKFKVLPWSDGLQLNQINSLHIKNDLSLDEWIEFLHYLKINSTLHTIRIDTYLGMALSLAVLRSLRNNPELTTIDLRNVQLFSTIAMSLQPKHAKKYLQSILGIWANVDDGTGFEETESILDDTSESEEKNDELAEHGVVSMLRDTLSVDLTVSIEEEQGNSQRQSIFSVDGYNGGTQLDISTDEVVIELARLIDRNDALYELNLANNRISDRSQFLFGSIVNSANLRILDLSYNDLSAETCGHSLGRHLGNIVIYCTKLTMWNLEGNELCDDELYAILNGFGERQSHLELNLNVAENCLSSEAIHILTTFVTNTKYLGSVKYEPQKSD